MKVLVFNDRVQAVIDPNFPTWNPPEGWTIEEAAGHVQAGWVRSGPSFAAPEPGARGFHKNYTNAQLAKREHWLSDAVLVRCFENSIDPPAVWRNYRTTLRQIIALENDTAASPVDLPPPPDLPAGI